MMDLPSGEVSGNSTASGPIGDDDHKLRVLNKFEKVFTLFCNPEISIEDDTIPDRLLSCVCEMLNNLSKDNGSDVLPEFLDLEGVKNLMTNAPLSHENKKIAAFTLKLYALLGKLEDGSALILRSDSFIKAFTGCCESDMFLDATIREAWFTALEMSLEDEEDLKLIIDIGADDKLMKSLTDPSLFVSKSAVKLLKKILLCLSKDKDKIHSEHQNRLQELEEIIKELFVLLATAVSEKAISVSTAMLNTMSEICTTEAIAVCFFWNDEHVVLMTQCLKDRNLMKLSTELCINVTTLTGKPLPSPLSALMVESPEHLIKHHRVDDGLRTAAKLLVLFETRDKVNLEHQLNLLRYPILLLKSDLSESLDQYFEGRSQFRRATVSMLCRCIDIMKSNPEMASILTLTELHTVLEASITGGTPICTKWSRFICGSTQVQKAILDYLKILSEQASMKTYTSQSEEGTKKTVERLIGVLESPDTDTGVMVKCLDTLLSLCINLLDVSQVSPKLGRLLQKLLCDVRWEVRDSALTFVAGLSEKATDCLILDHRLHQFVMDSAEDSDSYVRATALKSIERMTSCKNIWKTPDDMEAILNVAMKILHNDSEGFPRRAAITLISHIDEADLIPDKILQNVYHCVSKTGKDFDWEVKIQAVKFWENLIAKTMICHAAQQVDLEVSCAIPSYAQTLYQNSGTVNTSSSSSYNGKETTSKELCLKKLERLQANGCFEALVLLIGDYDQSVRSKACEVLWELRAQCEKSGIDSHLIEDELQKIGPTQTDCTMLMQDMGGSVLSLYSNVNSDNKTLIGDNNGDASFNMSGKGADSLDISCKENHVALTRFLCGLFNMDLDSLIKQSRQTTDEYVSNPESLLDDIIAWSTESEEILVDCY